MAEATPSNPQILSSRTGEPVGEAIKAMEKAAVASLSVASPAIGSPVGTKSQPPSPSRSPSSARIVPSAVQFIPARPATGPAVRPRFFSAFLMGGPGTWKTTMSLTAPKPIHVLDIDHKFDQMVDTVYADLDQVTYQQYSQSITGATKLVVSLSPKMDELAKGFDPTMQPVVTEEVFATISELAEMAERDGGKLPFATLVLDTVSRFSEHLKTYVVFKHGRAHPAMHDWDTILTNWQRLLNAIHSLPCNIVVTCHSRTWEHPKTHQIKQLPLFQGQFTDAIASYFQEAYYMEPKRVMGGGMTVMCATRSSSEFFARSTLTEIGEVPADFRRILAGEFRGERAKEYLAKMAARKEAAKGNKQNNPLATAPKK